MKRLRKIIFWCHLPIGVIGGVIILIMCVTGVLLAYEKQITLWADMRNYEAAAPSPEATRLPLDILLSKTREARNTEPTAITLRSTHPAIAEISLGREGRLFVNSYTGNALGEGSRGVRSFFRSVTDWHRWLGAQGENRNLARAITGACNIGFLFLVISGFYLWWPQRWSRKALRNITWFRTGLPPKGRNFNWHNTIGFWSAVPLFIVVLSGVVISYTWAGNLVYRIVGETPPAPRQANANPGATKPATAPAVPALTLDALWARAEQQVSGWQSITLQLSPSGDAPLNFAIDSGTGGQPQKRAQLVLDRKTGEVVRFEPFSTYSTGRQLRSILRFAHTGEVIGLFGQTIAGVVSLGGAFLVWTGLALALRRLRGWRERRSRKVSDELGVTNPVV